MPIQAPQWSDYLNCPVCCREFGAPPRSPISLGCGHTLCKHCLKHLHRKQCPFDQTVIAVETEDLAVNTALLQLAGFSPPAQPHHPPCIQALSGPEQQAYDVIVRCMEHLAVFLKYCGNANSSGSSRLSRPMQRKLVTLLQCAFTDGEGRGRAARAARSLGERTVTELILQHQNPQQLSANLWAAVRARGCQFLGPAMQEEVLKLVLLALEDGSALSRKVLVMFVVQRLEPHFPQASKTSIGHVVQLLYRASCFKVSKRECDSSLMQLKEEFRTYESLRREHDAQIVQIATEAGLRIAPDQWSALLYGDTAHKSHMQSIIDKLQTPQSFAQSVQELFIALQRTGDPAQLVAMSVHLDRLAGIDAAPDAESPSWLQLAQIMTSLKEVVSGLIHYLQNATNRDSNHNQKHPTQDRPTEPSTSQPSPQTPASTPTHVKYKVSMCRDAATRSFCPRGNSCTFAHSEEELERYRGMINPNQAPSNGNYTFVMMPLPQGVAAQGVAIQGVPSQSVAQQGATQQGVASQGASSHLPQAVPSPLPQGSSSHQQHLQQGMPSPLPVPQGPMAHLPHAVVAPLPQGVPQGMVPQGVPSPMPQGMVPQGVPMPLPPGMYQRYQMPPQHLENYTVAPIAAMPAPIPPEMMTNPEYPREGTHPDGLQPANYPAPMMHTQPQMSLAQNGLMVGGGERYYRNFQLPPGHQELQYRPEYQPEYLHEYQPEYQPQQVYQSPNQVLYQPQEGIPMPPGLYAQGNRSPFSFDDLPTEPITEYQVKPNYAPMPRERRSDVPWPPNDVFTFDEMRNSLPQGTAPPEEFDLEEELQALARRIDTEFKSTD